MSATPDDTQPPPQSGDAEILPPPPKPDPSADVFVIPAWVYNSGVVAVIALLIGIILGGLIFGGRGGIDETTLRLVLRELVADGELGAASVADWADDDPFIGPVDAPVTIVEFSDFLCPFCGRHYEETFTRLFEVYGQNIRYVYRDFPVIGGEDSFQLAMAAECADLQGSFWQMHDLMFTNQAQINSANLRELVTGWAEQLDLDSAALLTCVDDLQMREEVLADLNDAYSTGATGTPVFMINGRYLSGAQPFEVFAEIIDEELAAAGISVQAGG